MLLAMTDDGSVTPTATDAFVESATGGATEPSVRYEGGCLACGARFESGTERRVRDLVAAHACGGAPSAAPVRPHTASMMQPVEGALSRDPVQQSSPGSFSANRQQFATIVVALRAWQRTLRGAPDRDEADLLAAAERAGAHLDPDDVNDLIELIELVYKDESAKTVPAESAPPP
jgi:hypothetical protein